MPERRPFHATTSASRPAFHAGLTLIELLVAISILSFIAVLGWRGLDSIVRARTAIAADLEQTRGMQLTFAQLQSDCANLASATVLPKRTPILVEDGRLSLVRTVFTDNLPSQLQVVTYRVREGKLTRRESIATRDINVIDALWRSSGEVQDESQAVTLQSGVGELAMRVWIDQRTGWRTAAEFAKLTSPQAAQPVQSSGKANTPLLTTGLEVSIRLQGSKDKLLKIFLLGAV